MTRDTPTLIVLAKRPVPGAVKTRLTPPFTPEQAADLAAAALRDTLRAVGDTPARTRLLSFQGDPSGWCPPGWTHVTQPDGGLDVRIAHAFAAAGDGPALLVGMDTPQITPALLQTFDPDRFEAALGRATDGGYWAIGFRDARRAAEALPGIPMSTAYTADAQATRLTELGLQVQALDVVSDVDTAEDAARVAAVAPLSEFASTLATLAVGLPA
ncbi:TIGR04282 family arsenosugar biosynthesis glycosyltransferase [Jatrophihabitans sp. YIM 134969]